MTNGKLPNADIKDLYDRSEKLYLLSAATKRLNLLQLFGGKNYKIPAVAWSKQRFYRILGQNINKEMHLSQ